MINSLKTKITGEQYLVKKLFNNLVLNFLDKYLQIGKENRKWYKAYKFNVITSNISVTNFGHVNVKSSFHENILNSWFF